MLGGVYDPFSKIFGGSDDSDGAFPSIHIGVVRSYKASTNSVMVLVPTVNSGSAMGPCKVMKNYGVRTGGTQKLPVKGDKVVVAFLDGSINSAIVLGFL
jgi:hypothetical protein